MSLFKKIKLYYNIKLFDDYLLNKNYDLAYQFLIDLKKKSHKDYYSFLTNNINKLIDSPEVIFNKKIIWNISYDLDDLSFINNFFKIYLPKNSKNTFINEDYSIYLSNYFTNFQIDNKLDELVFNDFVNSSDLFQNLLLFDCDKDYLFLNSCGAFFETNQNRYFINPSLTFCYFYISPDPKNLYLKYKSIYKNSEASFNELFNFNNKQYLNTSIKDKHVKVYENRTNINTNIKSWTDTNVRDTYKGKIISYKKIIDEPQEVLLEIIYHLKQYGFDLDINLPDIQDYISKHLVINDLDSELSNNEKKFFNKNLEDSIKSYLNLDY